ncbi:hypothetical protein QYF36_003613 [Acer negundo]|nr:hypothetical protein QYF36_003613 [Acer negundo]
MASSPSSKTGSSATDGTSSQSPPTLNQQNINSPATTGSPVVITPTSNPTTQGSYNRAKGSKGYRKARTTSTTEHGILASPSTQTPITEHDILAIHSILVLLLIRDSSNNIVL